MTRNQLERVTLRCTGVVGKQWRDLRPVGKELRQGWEGQVCKRARFSGGVGVCEVKSKMNRSWP